MNHAEPGGVGNRNGKHCGVGRRSDGRAILTRTNMRLQYLPRAPYMCSRCGNQSDIEGM